MSELAPVAKLLGELLLVELTEERLAALHDPAVVSALASLDIDLPSAEKLEDLATDYFARFVNPQQGFPLVESLYRDGAYESESVGSVRAIAEAAGLEYDSDVARGAAPDHLGSLLILWSELAERDEAAAAQFAAAHLSWAPPVLARSTAASDESLVELSCPFYDQVSRAAAHFVAQVCEGS